MFIHVSHLQLTYTAINMQGGGGAFGEPNIGKLKKFGKLKIYMKVAGSIFGHIRSPKWQPS